MRHQKAFTLIELLVVIAIIALLLSIVMPALRAAKKAAQKTACLQNLRSISLANTTYAVEEDGRYVSWELDDGIWNDTHKGAPWCTNPKFIDILAQSNYENQMSERDYADVYQFPPRFRCPGAAKTWETADLYEDSYIATTYAGNYTSMDFDAIVQDDFTTTYVVASELKSPAKKIMFLDSVDICMIAERADYVRFWDKWGEIYDNDNAIGYGYLAPAYRHNEGSNGSYADGHAEYRPKERLFYYINDVEESRNGDWARNMHMWSFTGDAPFEDW
jgi:prepilin-type N-terminal cleavage/methylation domain-containing protein/prepilin-type processing-associated H-X9-DG protein